MVRVTFTLDEETVARLRRVAACVKKPQSQVVREAIKDYEARSGRLGEEERRRMLAVLDRIATEPPTRPEEEVDAEIREIRELRRAGWSSREEPDPS